MPTRGIHDIVRVSRVLQIQTLTNTGSPDMLDSGDIDLRGLNSLRRIRFGSIPIRLRMSFPRSVECSGTSPKPRRNRNFSHG